VALLPPLESVTDSERVREPLPTLVVFQAYEAVVPATVWVETTVPSTDSWNVRDAAVEPLTAMPTVTMPLTIAPAGGFVKDAVMDGGAPALFTFTVIVALPVLPVASRTVAVSGWLPLATVRVSYGIEMGPRLAVVVVPIVWPASVSVKVFELPLWPSTHITAHGTPLTVAPLDGCVIATRSVPPGGGGGGELFATVTLMLAEAVRPAESVSVADSVCAPSAVAVVFQGNDALLPIVVPSSRTLKEYGPVPPEPVRLTVTGPETVAPEVGEAKASVSAGIG